MNDLNLLDRLSDSKKLDRPRRLGQRLLVLVVVSGLCACFLCPLMVTFGSTPWWLLGYFVTLSIVLAIPLFPCIVFSLLDAHWGVRITAAVLSIATYLSSIGLGFGLFARRVLESGVGDLLAALPALGLAAALPLILLRSILGWHVVVESWNAPPQRQSISVSGLLIFTAIVAVAVAALKFSSAPARAAALCLALAGASLISLPPFVFTLFRTRGYWWALAGWSFAAFALTFGISFVWVEVQKGPVASGSLVQLSLLVTPAVIWLGLGLIAVRLVGGRLVLHQDLESTRCGEQTR